MKTVYISIGNSDDKLAQADWVQFIKDVHNVITYCGTVIHGVWHSSPASTFQNACFCAEMMDAVIPDAKRRLVTIATHYGQDSIAWMEGDTEFIKSVVAGT